MFSTRIAYVVKRGAHYELQIADADGAGQETALVSPEPIISPAWSPDGKRLAYVSFEKKKPVVYVHSLLTGERQVAAKVPRPNQFAYYGDDTSCWGDMAPFGHVASGHPPAYIVASQYEPYHFAWPSLALVDALTRCDKRLPAFRVLRNHNHVSSALQINSAIDDLGDDVLSFIRSELARPPSEIPLGDRR